MFNGRYNTELFREYGKWLFYISDVFLPLCDSESGDLRQMPFPGSVLEQPYMSMQIIKLIQLNYRKHLADKIKKMRSKRG